MVPAAAARGDRAPPATVEPTGAAPPKLSSPRCRRQASEDALQGLTRTIRRCRERYADNAVISVAASTRSTAARHRAENMAEWFEGF